jgi:hypothetical protein
MWIVSLVKKNKTEYTKYNLQMALFVFRITYVIVFKGLRKYPIADTL